MTFFSKFHKKLYKDQLWECKKLESGTSYHNQVIPFPVWSLICGHTVYCGSPLTFPLIGADGKEKKDKLQS